VRGWQEADLPEDSILNNHNLGNHLEKLAKKQGIDVNKPFPFMLKGQFKSLTYHISYLPKKHSKSKKPLPEQVKTVEDADVIIVGFFSKNHEGIFTQPGSHVVMSFMTTTASRVGQIDELVLRGKRVQLMLPE
jgi:acetolactate decarboxylase